MVEPPRPPSAAALASIWNAYFTTSIAVLSDPEEPIESIEPYVTASKFKASRSQAQEFRSAGYRLKGKVVASNFEVESRSLQSASAFVCVDNGVSELLDVSGRPIKETRPQRYTLRLTFTRQDRFRLAEDKTWTRSSVC